MHTSLLLGQLEFMVQSWLEEAKAYTLSMAAEIKIFFILVKYYKVIVDPAYKFC